MIFGNYHFFLDTDNKKEKQIFNITLAKFFPQLQMMHDLYPVFGDFNK